MRRQPVEKNGIYSLLIKQNHLKTPAAPLQIGIWAAGVFLREIRRGPALNRLKRGGRWCKIVRKEWWHETVRGAAQAETDRD
jgi:hypothetical protein